MMKALLSTVAMAACAVSVQAQRLSLYEEFSGENCGPCAAANPGLNTLLNANTSKIVLLKYQSPIPSAGPIYFQNTADVQARMTYYSVPFAPYGRMDGTLLGTGTAAPTSPGHVANLTQNDINNQSAVASPFNITVTHNWSLDGDSIYATVNVTANSSFSGSQMKLRAALVEHLTFATPPGTNGETDFHNVMRKMYPDAAGQTAQNSWTASQSQTYQIAGPVPAYVNKQNGVFLIVWMQDDATKAIAQVGKSTPVSISLDAGSTDITVPSKLVCGTGSASVVPTVVLKNAGTTTMTSATIYYKVDNGAYQSVPWTGSLAANGTVNVALPAQTLSAGNHVIKDSVTNPNNTYDINGGNATASVSVAVHDNTPVNLPLSTGFENAGATPTGWILYDANGNAKNWYVASSSSSSVGHNNSTYLIWHKNFDYASGEVNYAIMPHPNLSAAGPKALDFWVAYAQYQAEQDQLEVVYSTNCGQSWTSLWSKSGSALATAAPTTSSFVPTQTQWRLKSVDVSSVPAGAMLGFRATSNFGNNLFIDDVNLRTGAPVGVEEVAANNGFSVHPNPANTSATVSIRLEKASEVKGSILDVTGRVVATFANGTYGAGGQQFEVNTATLTAGTYLVKLEADGQVISQRISVAH